MNGMTLSAEELRVLGALIEKDMATPEYYPLSLNALVNACNQKNNREPMTSYDEGMVVDAIGRLRHRRLATVLTGAEHRVPKYGHWASETLELNNRELAVLCVLLLRGAQTVNEIKTRTDRLYRFDDLESVEGCLEKLAERGYTVQIPKHAGMREPRWMHLMGGTVEISAPVTEGPPRSDTLNDRVSKLEEEVAGLKEQLEAFRRQFE
jgi:hypothetical protein